MGRASRTKRLNVWMNGNLVGFWSIRSSGVHEFQYARSWLAFSDARPISLSLPLALDDSVYTGPKVEAFFNNLLPDNIEIRRRIQRKFSAATGSAFDLLAQIGRDCVGAIQLLSDDDLPRDVQKIDGEVLDEANIARALRNIVASSAGAAEDNFRISIAGAQEKTAFLLHNGKWLKPLGATPTTHIFKLPLGVIGPIQADMSGSVENEWLCSRIMTALGLPVAQSSISSFEDQKVLIVERFDRRLSSDGSWWMRLPQEDFCQATGTHPDSKYESEGGPGIVEIMDILLGSRKVQIDRKTFFKTQILFWILATPDGHAKNFSLHIESKGRFTLAPLYDVMSAYPVLGHKKGKIAPEKLRMAMAVIGENRHYEWSKIRLSHWVSTAVACGIRSEIETIISELIIGIPEAVQAAAKVLPKDFPASISDPIFEGALEAASRLDRSTSSNTF